MYITGMLQVNRIKMGRSVVHKNVYHDKGKFPDFDEILKHCDFEFF